FSMTRNFADLARRFDATSLSEGRIGFFVINLNGASNPSGMIGIPFGTGLGVLYFLNACLHILSSNYWYLIKYNSTPMYVTSAIFSRMICIPFGTGLGELHFLNACLQILSSNEWNVITTTLPPIAVAAAD